MPKDRGFHRSDFTGSEGPGLKKLREARARQDKAPAHSTSSAALLDKQTGLSVVREHMRHERWPDAILAAAKFPGLGDEAAAIHRGREAIQRPAFQRQLKRDPEMLILEAKHALVRRYGAQ